MKVKIFQNNPNGLMVADYSRIMKQPSFRCILFTKILSTVSGDITLFIDTNQRIAESSLEQLESCLQQMQIRYDIMRAETNPKQFFGFTLPSSKKKPLKEKKIVMELNGNAFPKELFDVIRVYDLSFGFGKKKTFEELCEDYRLDNASVLCNPESFHESLYDSAVCQCLKSSFNVEGFIREAENEISI